MRLTAPKSTAYIGQVEIRGVQRVMEFEATDFHHTQHHHHNHSHNHNHHTNHHRTGQPSTARRAHQPSQAVSPADLDAVQSRTVIVVPCKDEPLDRIMSVWAGIPPQSLIMSVSGSTTPEAYAAERDALAGFCRDTGRSGMCVWQRDPALAGALRAVGLTALLDGDGEDGEDGAGGGLVHKGKGEALVIGIALAAVARGPDGEGKSHGGDGGGSPCRGRSRGRSQRDGSSGREGGVGAVIGGDEASGECEGEADDGEEEDTPTRNGARTGFYKYIGFVDADNFVPGSVQEYCKAFSSGLHLASAEDAMVRISWGSKPKVKDGNIEFKKSGRSSEIVNRWFNRLLREMKGSSGGGGGDGGEAEGEGEGENEAEGHICTGNAGEHAMTISLSLKLRLASGYAIEPFHFLDIFERFAGGGHDDNDNSINNKAQQVSRAASSPPRPASLPELGSSPISSMSSSPLPTPMDCSPVLSATSPAGAPTNILALPLPPSATVEATVAAMRAMYNSTTSSPSPPSSAPPPPATGYGGPNRPEARGKVQILQVRTMNPHFHDTSKGESHIAKMWMQGLSAIYHSPVTAGLHGYREALWGAILEGKNKLEGGGDAGTAAAAAAGGWEPEKCRVYPAPADFDLLRLRDMLESGGGSFWWSGMEDYEESEYEYGYEDEEVEVGVVDDLPLEATPNVVDFGLDGCHYGGMSYRARAAIMDFLQDPTSPSGELQLHQLHQLQIPPAADAQQHGADLHHAGRHIFPRGVERAVRGGKASGEQQGNSGIWYPFFCP